MKATTVFSGRSQASMAKHLAEAVANAAKMEDRKRANNNKNKKGKK